MTLNWLNNESIRIEFDRKKVSVKTMVRDPKPKAAFRKCKTSCADEKAVRTQKETGGIDPVSFPSYFLLRHEIRKQTEIPVRSQAGQSRQIKSPC